MTFSKEELGVAWLALAQNAEGKQRNFALGSLKDAVEAAGKLRAAAEEDRFTKDADIDFTTQEKVLLLGCLEDREWDAINGAAVLSLQEKLK